MKSTYLKVEDRGNVVKTNYEVIRVRMVRDEKFQMFG